MNRTVRIGSRLLAVAASIVFSFSLYAKPMGQSNPPQTAADNSKANKQDRNNGALTADQQKMNAADRETTRKIRSAIHKDSSLSTYAHNIKIITRDGKVTLKGPVRSEEEKNAIAVDATAVAGEGNVRNEITVAPPKS